MSKIKEPTFDLDINLDIQPDLTPDNRLKMCGVVWQTVYPERYWTAYVDGITFHIERLMPTCSDRGDWKVLVESRNWKHSVDDSDMFPRYYFNWDRMLLEIEEWIRRRALKQRQKERCDPPTATRFKTKALEI